ncbi:hypothetical protein HYX18_04250 [Candidatus Woesearchaeota archaeon]|nr:hypothetical protein [Candidatus Woesearchaeota archaeon]
MQSKRGQAALEFLMTYGWAILVVLIVIGILWSFIGNPADILGDKCILPAGSSLFCEDQKAEQGSATVLVRNGLAETINVNSIELTEKQCKDKTFTQPSISPGATTTFIVECSSIQQGEYVRSSLKVNYDVVGGLTNKTATGRLIVKAV